MADLGRQVKYGIGKGADAAATKWVNQLKFELNPKSEYINNESAYGVIEKTNQSDITKKWAEGSLEAKLTSGFAGDILLASFGTVVTSDNADTDPTVKDHTFTINQNISGQPYTFYRKDGLSTEKYTLGRVGNFELSMELDDYIKYTADVMAKVGVTTTATPAYNDETEFVAKHFSVKTAANTAGLAAALNISSVESFTLTANSNIEADFQAGDVEPYGFTSRGYELSFEMTARYNDTVYETAYRNGTTVALQVTAKNTDVTIGATAKPGLVFTAPKVNITDWARSEDLDSPITQTFTGTIHYSAADAYALRGVLTNTTAAY